MNIYSCYLIYGTAAYPTLKLDHLFTFIMFSGFHFVHFSLKKLTLNCCLKGLSICRRLVGLGVWFSLRVREVPGSNPGRALRRSILYSCSFSALILFIWPNLEKMLFRLEILWEFSFYFILCRCQIRLGSTILYHWCKVLARFLDGSGAKGDYSQQTGNCNRTFLWYYV